MSQFLNSILDLILERSTEEVIEGIFLALFLALPMAGAYAACRRKAIDASMLLVGLAMVANLAGMAVASGYIRQSLMGSRGTAQNTRPPDFPRPPVDFVGRMLTHRILANADTNHDGLLSTDEATTAAAAFVEAADVKGDGSLDVITLRAALQDHMRPHHDHMPGHASMDSGMGPGPSGFPPR